MNRSYDFAITQGFMENLAKNEPYQRKSYKNATGIQFFQYFYDITHLRHEEEHSSELMLEEMKGSIAKTYPKKKDKNVQSQGHSLSK